MNKYELALVLSAKIDDDARADLLEKAKGYISRYDGVVGQTETWGKRRLAYEIAHQREGFYYFIHFDAEPSCPAEVESHVRIMDNVLRYLIVRTDSDELFISPEAEEAPKAEQAEEAPVAEAPAEEAPAEEAPAETAEEAPAAETEEAPAEENTAEAAE
ncbi:MAG: 30S ribosomal protein S6 [Lachnospiraceae bacterium]|nr:30S ribosomal protein S6 [Lachnospiraceae bacterium]